LSDEYTEADTCRIFVVPNLKGSGWTDEMIREQLQISAGRIVPEGRTGKRLPPKRPDYTLFYAPNFKIAVVEAKSIYKTAGGGMQQAIEYARTLGLKFACILEFAILVMLLIPTSISYASQEETQIYVGDGESAFYREDGYTKDTENRPAINPDFAPDRSCDLKWELKCIPGSEQSCLDIEGYNNGEMNVCTPIGCPEGYHDNYEDEDNICHSNEKECPQDLVLVKDEYGDTCKPEGMNVNTSINSDGDMNNDIPVIIHLIQVDVMIEMIIQKNSV
jgi:hypothetical protein